MTDGEHEGREDARSNVFLTAHLRAGARSFVVRVRNISAGGAMLDGSDLPRQGTRVRLDRGSLAIGAIVVWESLNTRGIRFDDEIDITEWVKRIGHAGQQRVDRAVEALRSGVRVRPVDAVPHPHSIRQLSEELRQICEQIASIPDLSIEAGEGLIRIEAIALELARVAEHEDF